MIDVKHLYHDYEGKGINAVADVSFHIDPGKIFGFLGPSGAGKSTVQNIMTGLLKLQKGEVTLSGESVMELTRSFFNSVGYSFEQPNLYPKLTGYENLKYYAGLFSVPTEDPMKLLNMVGLGNSAHKGAGKYSKGMKQRLVFVRSIINNPKILFLDEPLAGLDPSTAEVIKDIIREKQRSGTTIILSTHNMYAAEDLCDTVAFLNEGKIVAMDEPRELKLKYGERSVGVEHKVSGTVTEEVLFLDADEGKERLKELIEIGNIRTMHTREANLEQIFMKLTGRGLE